MSKEGCLTNSEREMIIAYCTKRGDWEAALRTVRGAMAQGEEEKPPSPPPPPITPKLLNGMLRAFLMASKQYPRSIGKMVGATEHIFDRLNGHGVGITGDSYALLIALIGRRRSPDALERGLRWFDRLERSQKSEGVFNAVLQCVSRST